ncbi:MAG: cob(I)yrinic acid a,c-diamide adenosyltransferase [Bacteroidia bacterium]|nr:cob(I)yrinic acid a,c-diamide adenosyltransferase [Bacteroidia bacterium]MCC7533400.1 cob(I)yrinic acid a,c-diamide adenosyltransferase [Bacteroidia bacterium]
MTFKIYTKTGDKGETSLIGGVRVPKHHIRIESYGTVDELNSYLGVIIDGLNNAPYCNTLREIQDRLFTIGSELASDPIKSKMKVPDLFESDIELLETEMDKMDATLPMLKKFILPGGNSIASHCHVARCICRRAERIVVHLANEEEVPPIIYRYLNRLSDYLFMLSRKIVHDNGGNEIEWNPRM